MKRLLWTSSALLIVNFIGGCAVHPATEPKIAKSPAEIDPGIATALVFDPPILFAEAPIDISRENRGTAAFAGFVEPTVDFVDVYTENRQSTNGADYIHRDSYSEKLSAVHR